MVSFFETMKIGQMFYSGAFALKTGEFQTVFIIKDKSEKIKKIKKNPPIKPKLGKMYSKNALGIWIIFQIDNEIYEMFLNYHENELCREAILMLAIQHEIVLKFYDEKSMNCRDILIYNFFQSEIKEYIEASEQMEEWTHEEFEELKAGIIDMFSTKEASIEHL